MKYIPFAIYFLLCFLVAFAGRNRKLGFWWIFIFSVIFTPLLVGVIMLVMAPRREAEKS